jgi:hypothetical protein
MPKTSLQITYNINYAPITGAQAIEKLKFPNVVLIWMKFKFHWIRS